MGAGPEVLYFNDSQSSTASACPSPRTPREIYMSYMAQTEPVRRLRKAVLSPANDAAGLVTGTRYQGRGTPLKGKGLPPPDQKEEQFVSSRRMVLGRSFANTPRILEHTTEETEIAACTGASSLHASLDNPSFRPCLKLTEHSFRTGLKGSAVGVTEEFVPQRKLRGKGGAAPKHNTARVFCAATEEDIPGAAMQATWTDQTARASLLSPVLERPSTAPAKSQTLARKYYQEVQTKNNDVFHYRHSGGICPDEYKFAPSRMPAPQLVSHEAAAMRQSWNDARSAYSYNRVRAITSGRYH